MATLKVQVSLFNYFRFGTHDGKGFDTFILEAEIDVNNSNLWIEFGGTGNPDIDMKYENVGFDVERGVFIGAGYYNRETGEFPLSRTEGLDIYLFHIQGALGGPQGN